MMVVTGKGEWEKCMYERERASEGKEFKMWFGSRHTLMLYRGFGVGVIL